MDEREEDITDSDAPILVALAFSREVPTEEGLEAFRQIIQTAPKTLRVKEIVAAEAMSKLAEDELPVWVKEFVNQLNA